MSDDNDCDCGLNFKHSRFVPLGSLRPIQTAGEARAFIVVVRRLLSRGPLPQPAMDDLARRARFAVSAKGLAPWERDYLDGLADVLSARGPDELRAGEDALKDALKDVSGP